MRRKERGCLGPLKGTAHSLPHVLIFYSYVFSASFPDISPSSSENLPFQMSAYNPTRLIVGPGNVSDVPDHDLVFLSWVALMISDVVLVSLEASSWVSLFGHRQPHPGCYITLLLYASLSTHPPHSLNMRPYVVVPLLALMNMGASAATIRGFNSKISPYSRLQDAHNRRQLHNADFSSSSSAGPAAKGAITNADSSPSGPGSLNARTPSIFDPRRLHRRVISVLAGSNPGVESISFVNGDPPRAETGSQDIDIGVTKRDSRQSVRMLAYFVSLPLISLIYRSPTLSFRVKTMRVHPVMMLPLPPRTILATPRTRPPVLILLPRTLLPTILATRSSPVRTTTHPLRPLLLMMLPRTLLQTILATRSSPVRMTTLPLLPLLLMMLLRTLLQTILATPSFRVKTTRMRPPVLILLPRTLLPTTPSFRVKTTRTRPPVLILLPRTLLPTILATRSSPVRMTTHPLLPLLLMMLRKTLLRTILATPSFRVKTTRTRPLLMLLPRTLLRTVLATRSFPVKTMRTRPLLLVMLPLVLILLTRTLLRTTLATRSSPVRTTTHPLLPLLLMMLGKTLLPTILASQLFRVKTTRTPPLLMLPLPLTILRKPLLRTILARTRTQSFHVKTTRIRLVLMMVLPQVLMLLLLRMLLSIQMMVMPPIPSSLGSCLHVPDLLLFGAYRCQARGCSEPGNRGVSWMV